MPVSVQHHWPSYVSAVIAIVAALGSASLLFIQIGTVNQTIIQLNSQVNTIQDEVHTLQNRVSDLRNSDTELNVQHKQLQEIICNSDTIRNLMHAYDLRFMAILWSKVFPGNVMPIENAYYPAICKN